MLLDGMAALHERYWGDPALLDPALGLCTLPWLYPASPPPARREARSQNRSVLTPVRGVEAAGGAGATRCQRLVRGLQRDLRPLCRALRRYPWTFVHGDLKRQNVGLERGPRPRVVLLDWQFATRAPPAVDLGWLLSMFAGVLPISLEEAIEQYRACLARQLGDRFDDWWWHPQLELALLGQLLGTATLDVPDDPRREPDRARALPRAAGMVDDASTNGRCLALTRRCASAGEGANLPAPAGVPQRPGLSLKFPLGSG